MVIGGMDGTKYDLFMVFKSNVAKDQDKQAFNDAKQHGFGRILWNEVSKLQSDYSMMIYGNRAGWWNAKITVAFLKHHFGDRNPMSPPKLLLLDHFSGHWTDEVVSFAKSVNVHLLKIPAGMTWRCQPADVAWMKALKDRLRSLWVAELRRELDNRQEGVPFKMVAPTRATVAAWVKAAWDLG
ncbi:hypothetical protein PINS_up011664 [Pythium insidiosum]|nr:hypothetical protein PINS_up011664 [Pythium insidiosum]